MFFNPLFITILTLVTWFSFHHMLLFKILWKIACLLTINRWNNSTEAFFLYCVLSKVKKKKNLHLFDIREIYKNILHIKFNPAYLFTTVSDLMWLTIMVVTDISYRIINFSYVFLRLRCKAFLILQIKSFGDTFSNILVFKFFCVAYN